MGEDIYGVLNTFEKLHPQYRVTSATATARDLVGDAQRLLSAIAGGVPPDLVFFDRFAIGEWASKHALEDLTPYLESQDPSDPRRIDFGQYYPWAVDEASYRPPGSTEPPRVYGVPMSADIRLLFSNLDLLRQEGIVDKNGDPKPPVTWEELRATAKRLNRYRVTGDPNSGLTRLGFAPNYGNSYLYMFAFQSGGELLSPDRLRVTMSSPPVVRALRFMTDVYDDLGGVAQANALQQSFQAGPLDPFVRGQVAMMIHGNWYLDTLGDWKPEMNFSLTPAPMPEEELAKGRRTHHVGGRLGAGHSRHGAAQEGRLRAHSVPEKLGGRLEVRGEQPRAQAQRGADVPAPHRRQPRLHRAAVSRRHRRRIRRFPSNSSRPTPRWSRCSTTR